MRHCDDQRQRSEEKWNSPSAIRPELDGETLTLRLGEDGVYRLNDWSFTQVCGLAKVSKDTVNKLRPETAVAALRETLPGIWRAIRAYPKAYPRPKGDELLVTSNGQPIVHTRSDSFLQWWNRLRTRIGETKETLDGFYVLRHLGATEFGSRNGCSISAMKRWLGHSASSSMADVYMRPVSPERRAIVEAVRKGLLGKAKDSPFG